MHRAEDIARHTAPLQPAPVAAARPKISTHILDTAKGCPAEGVPITLAFLSKSSGWTVVASAKTDSDGRSKLVPGDQELVAGLYKVTFSVAKYAGDDCFFPTVDIHFQVKPTQTNQHFHVPLLLSPFGYSTYRGS